MENLIKQLKWRGMIHNITPALEEQLQKRKISFYVGIDPTASSLHIGNLAIVMLLKHLQMAGHKPVILLGGATGMIGDPSGKSQERKLLDEEILKKNTTKLKKQLIHFLDFDSQENAVEIVNNYDWFKDYFLLDFLREVGKHFTINYMLSKDSVKNRLQSGISFTEFSYQLLQAYDFYHLYKHKNVKLQIGGSDQWGNIVSGIELIKRTTGQIVHALTFPLLTKTDGSKFGKSESGNIWLDCEKTSPYKFYQFWINCSDDDSEKLIKIFTLRSEEEITDLIHTHKQHPHLRTLQKAVAEDITTLVHGEKELKKIIQESKILFSKKSTSKNLQNVPNIEISKHDYENINNVAELLSNLKILSSKGEAKRMIKNGGISINNKRIADPNQEINFELLDQKYLVILNGKKNHYLLKIVN